MISLTNQEREKIKQIMEVFGLNIIQIRRSSRKEALAECRFAIIYFLHQLDRFKPTEIMEFVGRERSSFYTAIPAAEAMLERKQVKYKILKEIILK